MEAGGEACVLKKDLHHGRCASLMNAVDFIILTIETFLPGSLPFLLLGLATSVVLLFRPGAAARKGRWLVVALLLTYWLLATPLVSDAMVAILRDGYGPLSDPRAIRGTDTIVVLGGGTETFEVDAAKADRLSAASLLRAMEAARVYRMMDNAWLIVSGGIGDQRVETSPESLAIRDQLVLLGVPEARIVLESASRNTREQAVALAGLLRSRRTDRVVLVTSPTHMRRSVAAFHGVGIQTIASVAPLYSRAPDSVIDNLLPSDEVLGNSSSVFYECLGIAYYWMRGWLGTD